MLKYPLWVKILDGILTAGVPIIIAMVEIANSSSVKYKITFFSILIILAGWTLFNKIILDKYKEKLSGTIATLELNYATHVGEPEATLKLWKSEKLRYLVLNAVTIILVGLVAYLVIYGLVNALLKFLGAFLIIGFSYLVSFVMKAIYIGCKKVTNK